MITPPETNEYGDYFDKYISKVRGSDIVELLLSQVDELRFTVDQMTEETATSSYAPGKWSYKQLLGHINDTEKIMFFRALCVSRNEQQPLPGFEQDDYVSAANFDDMPLLDLVEDFEHIRHSILYFLKNLSEEALQRKSIINGQLTSTRALLYIITGHFEHHLNLLKGITQTDTGE